MKLNKNKIKLTLFMYVLFISSGLHAASIFVEAESSDTSGIAFEQGTWKEVLEKAKKTNKPIFVDAYASWCGPCKKMSKEIFPLPEIGKVFNAHFVCYKIDAEKGEGVEFAKKYGVVSYPTYLFINADGSLFSRSMGSMGGDEFIAVALAALEDMNDPKQLSDWEKEYADKKNDATFMLAYINKCSKVGKSTTQLFDEYLTLLPIDQRVSDEIIELYYKESRSIGIHSVAFQNLQENSALLYPQIGEHVEMFQQRAIDNSLREAATNKDTQLLEQVIAANNQLPPTPKSRTKEELYMHYYKQTDEVDHYIRYATLYSEASLMSISPDSIAKLDLKALASFQEQREALIGKIDAAQLAQLTDRMAHVSRNRYSQALNAVAWAFFEKVTNTKALENALRWSDRAIEIYPENPALIDTNANLLYKLGRTDAAKAKATAALNLARSTHSDTTGYEATLQQINAGEKTWK